MERLQAFSSPRTNATQTEQSNGETFLVRVRCAGHQIGDFSGKALFTPEHDLTLDTTRLPLGTRVEVEFDRFGRIWSFPAKVVRRAGSDTGLVFCEELPAHPEQIAHCQTEEQGRRQPTVIRTWTRLATQRRRASDHR